MTYEFTCSSCNKHFTSKTKSQYKDKTLTRCNQCFDFKKHTCTSACDQTLSTCKRCGDTKPLREFKIFTAVKSGHLATTCSVCTRTITKEIRERYNAQNKQHDCAQRVCNQQIAYCSEHREYHKLTLFTLTPTRKSGHSSICRVSQYRNGAKERNYAWNITDEEAWKLFTQECFYCGSVNKDGYNGIDRFDNSVGYTTTNCVPCCSACNISKSTQHGVDFIARAKLIAARHL